MTRARLGEGLLLALFVTLPLATSLHEIATALALARALLSPTRGALLGTPWARPALATALVWALLSVASGDTREGLGHAWLLAPLVAVPALVADTGRDGVARAGLAAAGLAALWAVGQRALGEAGTAGFSHHLTLGYALLPPFGVALAGRSPLAAPLALGVLATGSLGAGIALLTVTLAVALRRPALGALVGAVATVALLPHADARELGERAVLWTGGLAVAADGATGPGGYEPAAILAYDALRPGFWFPYHAHDAGIQVLAVLGPAGLVATVALCLTVLRRAALGPAAGLAGVLVGGLSQDVLGDLEVARATWAWAALFGAAALAPGAAPAARATPAPEAREPCAPGVD